jgi:hypothetical protein
MYISHDVTYRIFSIEIVTKEPVTIDMELFKDISRRLFENKVISNINIDNNEAYNVNDKQIFHFDIHLGNVNNPLVVRLTNVEKALDGLLAYYEDYSEMQIKLN